METNNKRITVDAGALKVFARGISFRVIDGFPAAKPFDGHPTLAHKGIKPQMSSDVNKLRYHETPERRRTKVEYAG